MENSINPVGKQIRLIRLNKQITQEEMATALGVTQSNYGRLEKNDNRISVVKLKVICQKLGIDICNLLVQNKL